MDGDDKHATKICLSDIFIKPGFTEEFKSLMENEKKKQMIQRGAE